MAKRLISLDTKEIGLILEAMKDDPKCSMFSKRLTSSCKRIKASSAKQKGRKLQQETCEMVSRITGIEYVSGEDGLIESRGMGQNGVDIALRGEARKRFPFSIECKATESFNFIETIEQADSNKYQETDWLIVHDRKRFKEPIVMMSMSTFEKILKR